MNRRARRWKAAYQDIAEIREQRERDVTESAPVGTRDFWDAGLDAIRARTEAAEAKLADARAVFDDWNKDTSPYCDFDALTLIGRILHGSGT